MSKKVLIVHLAHWDQIQGGAEQQIEYLSQYLLSKGNEVHRIYLNVNNKPIKSSAVNNYPITPRRNLSFIGKNWFLYKEDIYRIAKRINADLLITRSYTSWAGIVAKFAAQRKIKHVHFIAHDDESNISLKKINCSKPLNLMEFCYFKNIFKLKSEIIVQNDFQKTSINDRYALNVKKITQACQVSDEKLILKDSNKLKIIWIGNFKSVKRPEEFLSIVEYFSNNNIFNFIMIGLCVEQRYHDLLKKHKDNSNFNFTGELSNNEVNTILNETHILINTSSAEGFSNTFLQAWMRKNIVISYNSNPDGILTSHKIGFLTGSVDCTVGILNDLAKSRNKLNSMSDKAREYALKNHNISNVYAKILAYLNE